MNKEYFALLSGLIALVLLLGLFGQNPAKGLATAKIKEIGIYSLAQYSLPDLGYNPKTMIEIPGLGTKYSAIFNESDTKIIANELKDDARSYYTFNSPKRENQLYSINISFSEHEGYTFATNDEDVAKGRFYGYKYNKKYMQGKDIKWFVYINPKFGQVLRKLRRGGNPNTLDFSACTDADLKQAKATGLTHLLNQQQSYKGVRVALKELYYDRTKFSFAIVVTGTTSIPEPIYLDLYYKNQRISRGNGGGVTPITKDSYFRCFDIPLNVANLPKRCTLHLIGTDGTGTIKKYDFEIPVDFNQVDSLSKEIIVEKTYSSQKVSITISNITFTPTSTNIAYKITYPKDKRYDVKLYYYGKLELESKAKFNNSPRVVNGNFATDEVTAVFGSLSTLPPYVTLDLIDTTKDKILDHNQEPVISEKLEVDKEG